MRWATCFGPRLMYKCINANMRQIWRNLRYGGGQRSAVKELYGLTFSPLPIFLSPLSFHSLSLSSLSLLLPCYFLYILSLSLLLPCYFLYILSLSISLLLPCYFLYILSLSLLLPCYFLYILSLSLFLPCYFLYILSLVSPLILSDLFYPF